MRKILIATVKPFAPKAIEKISSVFEKVRTGAGYDNVDLKAATDC